MATGPINFKQKHLQTFINGAIFMSKKHKEETKLSEEQYNIGCGYILKKHNELCINEEIKRLHKLCFDTIESAIDHYYGGISIAELLRARRFQRRFNLSADCDLSDNDEIIDDLELQEKINNLKLQEIINDLEFQAMIGFIDEVLRNNERYKSM